MKNHRRINNLLSPWLAVVLIALFGALIYCNIYRAPFVFDDLQQIEENAKIRDLSRCLSPGQVFSPRPLVELTFALNYKLGGLNVFGYHVVNVLIHIINGFLVYFLALAIFKRLLIPSAQHLGHSNSPKSKVPGSRSQVGLKLGTHNIEPKMSEVVFNTFQSTIDNRQSAIFLMSLFAALIFVAHPIQTQAVTYTAQRFTSMAAMFYFLSILCYVKARLIQQRAEGRGRRSEDGGQRTEDRHGIVGKNAFSFQLSAYFALAFLCGVLAFLSKQNTASLPGVILLVEYILFDRTWQGWKKNLLWFGPIFVIMGIFILYVSGILREGIQFGSLLEDVSSILRAPETDVSRWIYLCTQFNVVVIYIGVLFFPVGQNLDWLYPFKSGFLDGYTPVAFLFLIAVVCLGVWNVKKRPIISFGIFWFFITLSIESSVFPIKDALFEHRLYLPMFGFAIIVAYIVFRLLPVRGYWPVAISVLIVVSLGTATYLRNQVWQDPISLWTDSVAKNRDNYRAHINLGYASRQKGKLEDAVTHYLEAIRIAPNFATAHSNLGVALAQQGNLKDAFSHFSEALRIKPGDSEILTNYGQAHMQQGNIKEAVLYFSRALKIRPDNSKAHNNLGIALAQQGNLKDAMVHFSEAVRIEPHNAKIHRNLGQAFMLQGNLPKAAYYYSKAVHMNPGYAEAHCKLGVILVRQGDVDGGIEHFSKALKIKPGMNEARQGMNRALRLKDLKNPPYR